MKKDTYLPSLNGWDIIYLPTEEPFLSFKTNGVTTFNGQSFAKVEELKFYTEVWRNNMGNFSYNQEDVEQINSISMQEIKGIVKVIQCHRLEELKEGSELITLYNKFRNVFGSSVLIPMVN